MNARGKATDKPTVSGRTTNPVSEQEAEELAQDVVEVFDYIATVPREDFDRLQHAVKTAKSKLPKAPAAKKTKPRRQPAGPPKVLASVSTRRLTPLGDDW